MTSRSGNVFLLGLVILINYQCLLCYQTGPQGAVTCVHFYFSLLQSWILEFGLETQKKDPVDLKSISSTQPCVFKAKYSVL